MNQPIKQVLFMAIFGFLVMTLYWQSTKIRSLNNYLKPLSQTSFYAGCVQGFGVGAEGNPDYKFEPAMEWCYKQSQGL